MKHIQWVASMCLLFYSRMPLCLFVSVYVELDLIRNSQSVLPIGGGSSRLKACFESTDSQDAVSGPKEETRTPNIRTKIMTSSAIVPEIGQVVSLCLMSALYLPKDPMSQGMFVRRYSFSSEWKSI